MVNSLNIGGADLNKYAFSTQIKTHETDYQLHLKTSALLQIFQDAAVNHALSLKVGYNDMKKHNLFWVITRFHIEIDRMPRYDETVKVITWPKILLNENGKTPGPVFEKKKDDFVFLRDFLIRETNGHEIIKATSSWVILDFTAKKIQPASKLPVTLPQNISDHAIPVIPKKISESEYPTLIYRKQVGYSDIDLNLHVNNTRYADWIMDVFPHNYLEKHSLKALEINYLREIFWEDRIDLFRGEGEIDNSYIVEGIEQRTGKAAFRAYLEFQYQNKDDILQK